MNEFLFLKLVHVLSATLLLGTGLGSAFYMLMAVRGGNVESVRVTASNVVLADWLFTTPAVIIQPVTGIWLMLDRNFPFSSRWFITVISLYIFIGCCWLPVVYIQTKLKNIALETTAQILPPKFYSLFRIWTVLGVFAFLATVYIYYLMIAKPNIH